MTERQGVFPPEGTEDGTLHHFRDPRGHLVLGHRVAGRWILAGYIGTVSDEYISSWGGIYLGPAATYEQSQADAADARRFRWLLDNASVTRPIPNEHGGYTIAGRIFFETTTGPTIRAAIDAAMKEQGDG